MKKYLIVLIVAVLFIFAFVVTVFSNDIVWDDIGRGNLNLKTALVNPDRPQIIYAGSSSAVLKSEDGGLNWRNILSIKGQNKAVNFLLFGLKDKNSLYAATGNGLFYSVNQGKDWKRIFKGKDYLENECTTLAVLPYGIYLGTKGGLFVSKDRGRSWHKETGQLGKGCILAIAYGLKEPNCIYVACVDGVFKSKDSGQSWERTFVASSTENGDDAEEVTEDQDEAGRFSHIRYIITDPRNPNQVYLATSGGVYKGIDGGLRWELLSDYGLFDKEVKFLLISSDSILYAATARAIFRYEESRWYELSLGLVAQNIRFLDLDKSGNLYAACDKGLFKSDVVSYNNSSKDNIISLCYKDEPEISDVQQAAIKYAEVEPEKIALWRKRASKKAFLPKVSVGVDRDTTDLWHWDSAGSTTKVYDDVLMRGKDAIGWDVTLSWELGDLIWSEAQTSIDVRSRLMVQLRDDVLDEVTKLYFERIRIKMELDNLSIEDRKKRFEKELRLQELTAQLDGLTGGYFSRQVKPGKSTS